MYQSNITDNGTYAIRTDAFQIGTDPIMAQGNWWGVTGALAIEPLVQHHNDNSALLPVDYLYWSSDPFDIDDTLTTDIDEPVSPKVPASFVLHQNYPNPFNPATTIRFDLPRRSHVRVAVYNLLGREIAVLADRVYGPGLQEVVWKGTDAVGQEAASGVYFYRVETEMASQSRKMVLVR